MAGIRFDIGDREIDGDDYFVVIEPVFWAVNIYDGPDRYEQGLANFSTGQRLILAHHWYLCEVNNGGHDQFYYNSTGIVWPDALRAFTELGFTDVAAIIRESANRLGGNPSLDREEREKQLDQLEPEFEDLDEKLFKLQEHANFDEKVLEFIRARRDDFRFSGVVTKV